MGEELVRIRTLRGMTQRESAAQIGVNQTTLARWERDERLPRGERLSKLKRFLGLPVLQEDLSTLGKQIRAKRLDLGLTQRQFAERLGVTRHTISMWETDRQKPVESLMAKFSEFRRLRVH